MKKIRQLIMSIGVFGMSLTGMSALAATQSTPVQAASCGGSANILAIPGWYDGLCDGNGKIKSPKDFATAGDDRTGIGKFASIVAMNIVTILLYITGYVSLAFVIWGGFKYMISGDSSSGTSAAKSTILNAVIGLILSIMSIAIVRFIAGAIQ